MLGIETHCEVQLSIAQCFCFIVLMLHCRRQLHESFVIRCCRGAKVGLLCFPCDANECWTDPFDLDPQSGAVVESNGRAVCETLLHCRLQSQCPWGEKDREMARDK